MWRGVRADVVSREWARRMGRVGARDMAWRQPDSLIGAWRHVQRRMVVIFAWLRSSSRELSNGCEDVSIGSLERKFRRRQWVFGDCSTFDSSGHTGILTAAAEQYRRWLRQWKNARKDEDCTKHLEQWLWYHVRFMNNLCILKYIIQYNRVPLYRRHVRMYKEREWCTSNVLYKEREWCTSKHIHRLEPKAQWTTNYNINTQKCQFLTNLTFSNSPSISYEINSPKQTLFKCNRTPNITSPKNFKNISCGDYNIYYSQSNHSSLSSFSECSIIQLPRKEHPDKDELFSLLSAEFDLKVHVSDVCSSCHDRGGNVTLTLRESLIVKMQRKMSPLTTENQVCLS